MDRINKMAPKYAKAIGFAFLFGIAAIGVLGAYSHLTSESEHSMGRRLLASASDTKVCNGDTVLPAIPYENTWSIGVRGALYIVALGYLFLGVAISADVFMSAIEVITSKTKTVNINGEDVEVEVWNGTVANLTLMALGSSAPEILLAVVETISLGFKAGDLGPGTIVGSAAFNLLFITAICVSSLPEDEEAAEDGSICETRIIEEFGVFLITAVASLFAYLWMVIVLQWSSKDEINLVEALITLLMFPALVLVCWAQDAGWWGWFDKKDAQVTPEDSAGDDDKDGGHIMSVTDADGTVRKQRRNSVSDFLSGRDRHSQSNASAELSVSEVKADPKAAAQKAAEEHMKKKKKSRLEYRIQATRKMTGGKRVMPTSKGSNKNTPRELEAVVEEGPPQMSVGFVQTTYSVLENCGEVKIVVRREGITDKPCTVQFDTSDGIAVGGERYIHTAGVLDFKADQEEREIAIEIIDDNEWQPDENFFVRLFNPSPEIDKLSVATTQVIILNDDDPGVISFEKKTTPVVNTETRVSLTLKRKNGYDGNVLAFVSTKDGTAVENEDYKPLKDFEVHFPDKQQEATLEIELLKSDKENAQFTVEIASVEPEGAEIGENGHANIVITNDANYTKLLDEVEALMAAEMDKYGVGSSSWGEQFHDAMNMGSDDAEEAEWSDYLLHFCSFYWKVIHAVIPPTDYYGGWATFVVSLAFIAIITVFVGDTAKMFGCCIGLEDGITAITFVALGTSLPDTFASVEATVSDDTADAAITNVTGSNSVNVFLGLGLPWTAACIYHLAEGTTFVYPAGDLVFSVFVFFAFAVTCIFILIARRFYCGGELGGNKNLCRATSALLVALWFGYVILSALKTKGNL